MDRSARAGKQPATREPGETTWTSGDGAALSFATGASGSRRDRELERVPFPRSGFAAIVRLALRAPERPVIVATIGGQIAGYVPRAQQGRTIARIFSLAVDPRFARRGVGSALLAATEKYALRHERQAVTLEVRYDNAPAIALYEKWGFRPFGEHEDYYADGATALATRKSRRPPAEPSDFREPAKSDEREPRDERSRRLAPLRKTHKSDLFAEPDMTNSLPAHLKRLKPNQSTLCARLSPRCAIP